VSLFRKAAKPTAPAPAATAAPAEQTGPPIDPLLGDPVAHRFLAELTQGRWQEFHDFLDGVRNWDDRNGYVINLCAGLDDRPEWIEQWKAARPGSSLPYLFSGTHLIKWAWQARGSGRAGSVAEDAWAVFYARLVDADRDLARAAGLDDADPTPYARSIPVAMGLGLGLDERRSRFEQAVRRHRWHTGAHVDMIQALARKWGGSHEAMFEFARTTTSAQAPDGHSVHRVVALAHLEGYIDLPKKAEDRQQTRAVYFQRPDVRAEVFQAADRSIRSLAYEPSRSTPMDRNTFAMCFHMMHEYHAQLQQMNLIGAQVTASPWHYLGKPGKIWERARTIALAQIANAASARGPGS
jgi:hypothetical protein